MRIHYLSEFLSAVDVTWLMGPIFIWSTIEPSVAVVCACLPHLAPLARLAHRSIASIYKSQQSTGLSSDRQRVHGSGQAHQGGNAAGRGPTFDFGFDQMKREANDDEIGLTNYVTAGPNGGPHPSNASVSDDYVHDHSIAIHSSFVQSTSPRPSLEWRAVG